MNIVERITEGSDYTSYVIGWDWRTYEIGWEYRKPRPGGKEGRLVVNIWKITLAFHFRYRYD